MFLSHRVVALALLVICSNSHAQNIPPKPNPPKLVNDLAHIFQDMQSNELESQLEAYYDSTSTQIVVVTVNSLDGADVSDFAFKLGEAWGIGSKGKNNGLVFLIAPNERKMFIATGYGMESKLTDVFLTRTRESYIAPAFKQGNYYQGVQDGLQAIIKRMSGEYKADPDQNQDSIELSTKDIILIFVVLLFIVIIFSKISKNSNFSDTYSGRGYRSGPFGGGFFGGGGFDGGSFGGGGSGGFGGFGGGSFGGGGSGGSW